MLILAFYRILILLACCSLILIPFNFILIAIFLVSLLLIRSSVAHHPHVPVIEQVVRQVPWHCGVLYTIPVEHLLEVPLVTLRESPDLRRWVFETFIVDSITLLVKPLVEVFWIVEQLVLGLVSARCL